MSSDLNIFFTQNFSILCSIERSHRKAGSCQQSWAVNHNITRNISCYAQLPLLFLQHQLTFNCLALLKYKKLKQSIDFAPTLKYHQKMEEENSYIPLSSSASDYIFQNFCFSHLSDNSCSMQTFNNFPTLLEQLDFQNDLSLIIESRNQPFSLKIQTFHVIFL